MRVHASRGFEHGTLGLNADSGKRGMVGISLLTGLGNLHEIGAQSRNAALHQGVVHVGMGTAVVLVYETWLRRGVEFLLQGVAGEMSKEIGDGGRRDEGCSLGKAPLGEGLPDERGTDGGG